MEKEFIDKTIFSCYLNKVKDRIYGVLCEREKNGEWEKFLDTITIELIGYKDELNSINYWALMGKIHSLKYLDFQYFRKTIFECMNMVEVLKR